MHTLFGISLVLYLLKLSAGQGFKKTCLHNVPTIVQKLLLPTQPKPRTTSKCRNRDNTIEESPEIEDEPTSEKRISELENLR